MAEDDSRHDAAAGVSRRDFICGAAGSVASPILASTAVAAAAPADTSAPAIRTVSLHVNGRVRSVQLDTRTSLLDALRDALALTGTKKGCDHGQCGACTVQVNDERTLACMTLAIMVEGKLVTTIEGLADVHGRLHPMQQAFIDHDGFQCGYCTPGQIMSAIACVHEGNANSAGDIREYMSGNLCRCAAYPNIVAAVEQGRDAMRGGS